MKIKITVNRAASWIRIIILVLLYAAITASLFYHIFITHNQDKVFQEFIIFMTLTIWIKVSDLEDKLKY